MANNNFQLTGTDFDQIKNNLITFLQGQNVLTDANYTGSALSVLLDILAYNTYYNSLYLNLLGSEIFLDSALKRSSVISKAKELGYVPKSATSSYTSVNISVSGLSTPYFNIPKYARFLSGRLNNKNYTFVTNQAYSAKVDSYGNANLNDVMIYEGEPVTYNFTYTAATNQTATFNIPDKNVDLSSLSVYIQTSSISTNLTLFNLATSYINLDGTSQVYFVQEATDGTYDVYFGDGVLGQALVDGNIVIVNYISTSGAISNGINSFNLINTPGSYTSLSVNATNPSYGGSDKESMDSIKFQAPKAYAAQNRAVTKDDYITLLQQNKIGLSFDSVNAWGGEENNPPIYGQVFLCIKPSGGLALTDIQKLQLINNVLKPISLVTVEPTLIDPDYTYIVVTADVLYNSKLTSLSSNDIQNKVENLVRSYSANNLNTFNSSFSSTDVAIDVKSSDPSIITSDISIALQKKFYPDLYNTTNYTLNFNTPLQKGLFTSGISSYPTMTFADPNTGDFISGVYIEEIPSSTSSIKNISIINAGYSYQYPPTITISGDGSGATASAVLNPTTNSISSITVTNSGNNYSYAVVTITPSVYDKTGSGAAAIANLTGSVGALRSFYYNSKNSKTILNTNIGSIDYQNGIIYLNSFGPIAIDNPLGQLIITATPVSQILNSTYNTILTIDPFDPNAVIVNASSK